MKPYFERDGITIYHGDCLDVLPELSSVDLVLTDPPYVFGLASTAAEGKAGGWGDLMNNAVWYGHWLNECRRLLVNGGAAWVFNSWRSFPVLARASFQAQWGIESLLVWDKQWIGPGGQKGLRPSYELVALFTCGDWALGNRGLPDIWQSQWSSLKPWGHPAEKPVPLLKRVIQESEGRRVLDPFAGSGSTLRAAHELGIEAVGIEIEERWCEVAARRLEQMPMPLEIPA